MKKINNNLLFFRFKRWPKYWKVVLTNIVGDRLILSEKDFSNILENKITPSLKNKLIKYGFRRNKETIKKLINAYRNKHKYLFRWPTLHIIVVTKWCNLNCIYCHSKATGLNIEKYHLKKEIAEKYLKIIFSSPSPYLTIEFQWWEPTLAREIIEFIVKKTKEYITKTNKKISFLMTTNGYDLSDSQIKFMLENNFKINISIDWPEELHNKNRPAFPTQPSFEKIVKNIKKIKSFERQFWKKLITWWIAVITEYSLDYYNEIPQIYKNLEINHILTKYIDWLWRSQENKQIQYTIEEFIKFYENYLKKIKEINLEGFKLVDWYTNLFVQKIIWKTNPNFVDLQNPCWAAIWQVAYNRDGNIYTCDEWRTIENDLFKLWDRQNINSIKDIVQNENTAIMCNCSLLESNICDRCIYQPYCGICPVHNYINFWELFVDIRKTPRHKFNQFIQDFIFEQIITKNKQWLNIFNNWLKK